ncbi:hypothetical protein OROMI_009214 [Orobanche minor]
MSDCKLVVLGIPWDVETEGLIEYMSKFGELEDCIVMKIKIFVKWLEGCVPQGSLCKSPEEKRPDVLRKIGMEYVDMYLVHWTVKLKPWACSAVPNEQDFDKLDIVGTWDGMEKCLQIGSCRAIGVTESYSILMVLLICVTKVAKSAFDKALAEHDYIDNAVASEEPTERDHGVDLQQPLLIKIDSSDSHKK